MKCLGEVQIVIFTGRQWTWHGEEGGGKHHNLDLWPSLMKKTEELLTTCYT